MTSIRKATFTSALLGALVALFAIGPGFLLAEPVPGSPGGGGRVTSTMLETGAVTTTAILDGTILTGDIAADTILAADIATGAVTTTEILDSTIVAGDIATGAVTTTGILDATVAAADLATSAITSANVAGLANTASTLRDRVPGVLTYSMVAADFAANDDIILTVPSGHDILITDITYVGTTAEGGSATATFRTAANGGGTAISSALNLNDTAGNIQRTTVASVAGGALAAGASLYVHCSTNPGTAAGLFAIHYVHTN